MHLQSIASRTGCVLAWLTLSVGLNAYGEVHRNGQTMSASHVDAEVAKGKVSSSRSKPGDQIALRLKSDFKSNGQLVLTKGTTITGVVRSVKSFDGKSQAMGRAQSVIEIEWLTPATSGRARELSIALQSVTQRTAFGLASARAEDDIAVMGNSALPAGNTPMRGSVSRATTSNAALLNMPSVVVADTQTTAALDNSLGLDGSGRLFKVGHGELASANGIQSLDMFSHLSNDTVITSSSKDFEISTGAQVQLLIGVNKQ